MKMKLITAAALCVAANAVFAQTASPVGLWKTIDDDGKTAKSLVRITEHDGVLSGSIEKILDPAKQADKCDQCKDDRKDKPIVGLTIIRGVKPDADDKTQWSGGEILDPTNGKTYKTKLWSTDGGKTLNVRGYIGFLYRTQVWQKAE
ncbi:DUF2147 domain-containing protein [Pelomonas sp. KK5]|uniref:DUF2147 domain-containing protein n=1 Tax=Pelomonas sp. KK5 TaxID=1855730 RepID=UPI00097BEB29|nr:DUF2147 domain-containing protein [Pelomonas sp. KK5]